MDENAVLSPCIQRAGDGGGNGKGAAVGDHWRQAAIYHTAFCLLQVGAEGPLMASSQFFSVHLLREENTKWNPGWALHSLQKEGPSCHSR